MHKKQQVAALLFGKKNTHTLVNLQRAAFHASKPANVEVRTEFELYKQKLYLDDC